MIRKFRTIEEMNAFSEEQNFERDPDRLYQRLRVLFERSRRLAPGLPRGVFKFRSPEEANAWREQWVRERVQRLRTARAEAARD